MHTGSGELRGQWQAAPLTRQLGKARWCRVRLTLLVAEIGGGDGTDVDDRAAGRALLIGWQASSTVDGRQVVAKMDRHALLARTAGKYLHDRTPGIHRVWVDRITRTGVHQLVHINEVSGHRPSPDWEDSW
jgi:hypothetical protein